MVNDHISDRIGILCDAYCRHPTEQKNYIMKKRSGHIILGGQMYKCKRNGKKLYVIKKSGMFYAAFQIVGYYILLSNCKINT